VPPAFCWKEENYGILEAKPREAKKVINRMITEEVLEYWSSGSTSLYGLKGTGKQAGAEHEEEG
jgi:hypothetical protein